MYHIKLQIGCLIIVLFLALIYYVQEHRLKIKNVHRFSLFDLLILTGIFSLVMDGITGYTVNYPDSVSHGANLFFHALFFIAIDTVIFVFFLYVLNSTEQIPRKVSGKILIAVPYMLNIIVAIVGINDIRFIQNPEGNYPIGLPADTCFAIVAIYTLMICIILVKRWGFVEKRKRMNAIAYLSILIAVTIYQIVEPAAMVTSLAATALILGVYLNQEDPALRELALYHSEMVMGFATLIENRDESTGEHVRRTTDYVRMLTEALMAKGYNMETLSKDYLRNLYMAAPLHDIGKIAVPDAVLQKPGKLTDEEYDKIKEHTVSGGQIIIDTFSQGDNEEYEAIAYDVARHHHEKWNGKGYPDGLKGEEIPLCARIMSIADVFDAVSEKRCYKEPMPLDECFAIIESGKGTDFDPSLVDAFLSKREEIEEYINNNRAKNNMALDR